MAARLAGQDPPDSGETGGTATTTAQERAVAEAERLEGKRQSGPQRAPTDLVIGQFTDLESVLSVVAGIA